ncbi:MAG: AmmeMemoRadiSam system protein B [Candidatus Omnitrophica bacterium]|nr:AmmeMemoRadiSam system protein B [Candidatus Omnitrophota bacterium]
MIRKPIVAGKFYPGDKNTIKKQLTTFLKDTSKEDALACIMPHAGYIYSGRVATQTAASVEIKENIILLGPNHTGLGETFSIISQGSWQTPLGNVEINSTIAEYLKKECSLIKEDSSAHMHEHSLEVELPILQFLSNQQFCIVPLVLMPADKTKYEKVSQAIYKTITDLDIKGKTLIVASSDMTHYEPHESAKQKDNLAIEAILNLDEDLLMQRLSKYNISMCGYAPVITTIIAAKKLGAKKAKLIMYQTSGETSGDYEAVVGYAGITIS